MKKVLIIYLTTLVSITFPLFSDTLVTRKNQNLQNVRIESLNKSSVKLESGKIYKIKDIKSIQFDNFRTAGKDTALIFSNGSMLNGVIRSISNENIIFRSTTFGEITVPRKTVAAIAYNKIREPDKYSRMNEDFRLISSAGNVYKGRMFWSDEKSTGIKTEKGLKKIPSEKIKMVQFRSFADRKNIILRNDDLINFPHKIRKNKLYFKILNKTYSLPFKAVKIINFRR